MSPKSIVRASLAALALLGLGPGPGPRNAEATPVQAPSAPEASAPAAPAAPAPAPTKDPLLEFVPKEHVPADSAVSFPVDI
jgi:hypothetical protein